MDGQYLNNDKTIITVNGINIEIPDRRYLDNAKTTLQYLQMWSEANNKSTNSWMAHSVYLSEIKGLMRVKREDWITKSLKIFNIIVERFNPNSNNVPCLCVALKWKRKNIDVKNVSLKWLQKDINEFTPPSFFYSSLDYYNDYYLKLEKCIIDDKSLPEIKNFEMYYSSQFDELDKGFYRCIYIFKVD